MYNVVIRVNNVQQTVIHLTLDADEWEKLRRAVLFNNLSSEYIELISTNGRACLLEVGRVTVVLSSEVGEDGETEHLSGG
jgi:hypothetical protein